MTVTTRSTKKDIAREAWFRLLAVLAVILTPLFWPIGVLLLWGSPFWNRRDKVIGTLILPGGFLLALLLGTQVRSVCGSDGSGEIVIDIVNGVPTPCHTGPLYPLLHPFFMSAEFNHVFGAVVFFLSIALPILSALYLSIELYGNWNIRKPAE